MKIKNSISICCLIFAFEFVIAQVGINTSAPLSVFHIDGRDDNSNTPTLSEMINDVVVTEDGYVGLGTITPTLKLDIKTGGVVDNVIKGFALKDGNEGNKKFLSVDDNGFATWKSAFDTRLVWNAQHQFTIPHTGLYLITLYLDDNNTTDAYINKWYNPTLDNGTRFNGVALFSITRGNYVISNANGAVGYGVSCSGTLLLNKGEVLRPGALAWNGVAKPILGVEIIPL